MRKLIFVIPVILFAILPCFAETPVGKPSNVELTIYNQDFGLVREERQMTLDSGINFISVPDVAATIEPSSVAFKSKTDPDSVVVREQNYRYDVINRNNILAGMVGKEVRVTKRLPNGSVDEVSGTLISTPDNGLIIRQSDGNVVIDPEGTIRLGELPAGLVSKPTLVWKLQSSKSGPQLAEISYLANGIGWHADYVAVIDPLDKYLDLTGWVTLTNNSGATYENASLNLMAGDVRRVQPRTFLAASMYKAEGAAAPEPQFTEKSFFEYHLYTLKDKTTVRDKETKQITLITALHVPVKKIYIYDGRKTWWNEWRYSGYRPGESYDVTPNKKVNVIVETVNSKENNLGIPLPKGTVRVYKQEASVNQQFVGEDSIDHTPKDEKIRLYLGDAFDIVGNHTRTNFRRLSATSVEESFEVSIRNHKDQPVTVVDVEHLLGDWTITDCSHKYFKKDASTVEIPVDVPANGEVKIDYTVRTKW